MAEVSFGEWLKRRRKAQGLTQEELALQISCSTSALRKIEAEQRRPSSQIVEQLAEVFNIASTERKSFLKFARGDWQAAPTGVVEDIPWRVSLLPESEDPSSPRIHQATFLFTDIEGSTKLWENIPKQMKSALQRHHDILQEAISSNGGVVFQIVGDAFCAVFRTASSAISAAVTAQRALHQEQWDTPSPIRVRMGIHTGEAERTSNDPLTGGYASNHTLNRVARIHSAGHGGQVLLSLVTKELVKDSLPAHAELRDMGEHYLKNLARPEHLFQLIVEGLPSDFPLLNTLSVFANNLPIPLTSFIGRERETAEVKSLLSARRLLTLTGAGGSGKTRLAIHVATDLVDSFKDGVWWVELSPLIDEALVPQAIAKTLGVYEIPNQSLNETLINFLKSKQLLLVLDNCEHLITACAQLAELLLTACPNLKILATSREALGLTGESAWYVSTLSVPESQDESRVEQLSHYEAIHLFIERAAAAKSDFVLTAQNARSITQICRRLDGLPLALELAAARAKVLTVEQIATRLDDRFRLLTSGNRTALPRQQTLGAAIDWSYHLLTDKEQTLFQRLAVFAGSWTLQAAEAVCSGEDIEPDEVLDLMTYLVAKSLVIMQEQAEEARYHVLESIRQYAGAELLKSVEADLVRTRHLDFFMKLAERAEPNLLGIEPSIWLNRLEAEHDNMRAALRWSLGQKEKAEIGLRLAVALSEFWDVRGYDTEGRIWLEEALRQTNGLPTRARAMAFMYLTDFSRDLGATAESEAFAMQSITIFRQLGAEGQRGLGTCLRRLGIIAIDQNDFRKAQTHLTEALKHLRESGDRDQIARTMTTLGYISRVQGNYVLAQHQIEEGLKLAQGKTATLHCLKSLGTVLHIQGAYQRAQEVLEQGLRIAQELGSKPRMASILTSMGDLQRARENYEEAAQLYHQALNLAQGVGWFSADPTLFSNLGYVALILGNEFEAASLFTQSLRQFQSMSDRIGLVTNLLGIAGVFCARKDFVKETQLLSVVATCLEAIGVVLEPLERANYDRFLAAARSALGEMEFEQAWGEGQVMTIDEALDLALKTVEEM